MIFLQNMYHFYLTELDQAVVWILTWSTFFAVKSCEFSETKVNKKYRRTRIPNLKSFIFKNDGRTIHLSYLLLQDSDIVIISFN